jgi:hypothetical protein
MEIKLATWINAGERCTNQEEYIELKIFAPAILESNIHTWVISTCGAVAPHQGTKTLIFGYRANMVGNYFISCFYADALFSLPVGDNDDDQI